MSFDEGKHGAAESPKAREALKKLYYLLEQYAPSWYTSEHHDEAEGALGLWKVN